MATLQYRSQKNLSGSGGNDQQRSSSGTQSRGGQASSSSSNLNRPGSRPHSAGATRSRGSTLGTYAHVMQSPNNTNNGVNNVPTSTNAAPQLQRSNTGSSNGYPSYNNQNYSNGVNIANAQQAPSQPASSSGSGQGYAAPTFSSSSQNQRPSSAGVTRSINTSSGAVNSNSNPAANISGGVAPATNHIPVSMYNNNNNNNNQNNNQNNNPTPVGNANIQSASNHPQQRPKSAGAIRPSTNHSPILSTQAGVVGNGLYTGNGNPVQTHSQNKQQPSSQAQQSAQPYYSGYLGIPTSNSQSNGRPLSANATSHVEMTNENYSDKWSATYKLMYGGTNAVSKGTAPSTPTSVPGSSNMNYSAAMAPPESGMKVGSSSSTPAIKLRNAVDLSHRLDNTQLANEAALRAVQINTARSNNGEVAKINFDDDGDGDDMEPAGDSLHMNHRATSHIIRSGKDGRNNIVPNAATAGDDDEMDGKPINESRSHPEVSTTTPSQSVELMHGGSSSLALGGALDGRGEDSLNDDMINVGISTVPNQFCTKKDALELRKLLMMSMGTRGGIVPSSSAVMDMYMVGKVVGVGSYGKVRAAWHRLTGSKVAIKTYDKAKLKDPAHWKRVHSEIKIMEQISHPRIARMYEAVETPKRMHLIMECLDGGNLCSYVKAKRRLSEDESKRIFFQILQAIDHLHDLGVSHRDVKLENVLFADDKNIKLIDFGFSTVCQPGKKLKVFCGTPSYMAPEIVRRSEYEGKPVDIWSMGILLYALLCGCFPFRAKAYPDLYRRIARGTFAIPDELSAPVKDLLRQLLNVDASTRITAHAALRHPWLQLQLINAPNIDKMILETTILISDKPSDDLDDQVLSELELYGIAKDEMVRLVLTKTHSSLSTLYYLLLDTLIRRRRALAKKTGASMSVNIGALYNTIKGGGGGGTGSGGGGGNSVTGVGVVGNSGGGNGSAVVNAALQNNVNAVAAAATNSLSQRYKSINGVITAVGSSNSSSSNSNAAAAATQPVTVSSPRAMQPQYTGEITEYVPQQQPLSEFNLTRPQSASGVRTSAGAQRPLSAYAARR